MIVSTLDKVIFRTRGNFNEHEWEAWTPIEIRRGRTPLSRLELSSHRWGVVEMAFDHENGGFVVEVISPKICCGVIDVDHAATPVHWKPHPSEEETAAELFREDRVTRRASIL